MDHRPPKQLSGQMAAVASAAISGVSTVFAAGAIALLSPLLVTGIGQLGGAVILSLAAWMAGRRLRREQLSQHKRDILSLILLRGVVSAGLFAVGLGMTESIKAVFFTKIEPYFVLAWGILVHKERHKPIEFGLLALHLFGALLLSTGGDLSRFGTSQLGDLCIILAMAVSGTTYTASRRLGDALGARNSSALIAGGGALLVLPFALLYDHTTLTAAPLTAWGLLALHTLCFYVAALPLWFYALTRARGWIVSALRAVGPIAGAPVAWMLYGETLSTMQLAGGAVVIGTAALICRYR